MTGQRFTIQGHIWDADDPGLQTILARIYQSNERPRCMCVNGGVEMYVALHRQLFVKRMPDTGGQHHPSCVAFDAPSQQSGLGELVGEAILESEAGAVELRVDFPWTRAVGRGVARGESQDVAEVAVPRRRMSLRALMHFLFERAGFNRWSPAMEGRRNQAVLHKYLLEAAQTIVVKGMPLADRLYVPESFHEAEKAANAQRRRTKLAVLHPKDGQSPLALVIGEFKASDESPWGRRIWIKHMPDAPLLLADKTWSRLAKAYAPLLEARDADGGQKVRLMLAALIRERREYTYEIDVASLMLTSEHWVPIEGVHELPLVNALVHQQRRFIKPLRYDARHAAGFANAMLLDTGEQTVSLHIVSSYLDTKEQAAKTAALKNAEGTSWVWYTSESMPQLPQPTFRAGNLAG